MEGKRKAVPVLKEHLVMALLKPAVTFNAGSVQECGRDLPVPLPGGSSRFPSTAGPRHRAALTAAPHLLQQGASSTPRTMGRAGC